MSQEKEESKVSKFEEELKKLNSLLKGDKNIFNINKIENSTIGDIVEELTKERVDRTKIEFKNKLNNLLDKKLTFDKFKQEEENKFKKAVEEKEKEFLKELKELFTMVEDINELHKSYTDSLKSLN